MAHPQQPRLNGRKRSRGRADKKADEDMGLCAVMKRPCGLIEVLAMRPVAPRALCVDSDDSEALEVAEPAAILIKHPSAGKSTSAPSRPAQAVLSERRLKQYSCSGLSGHVPVTVGWTGARAGDLLRGIDGSSGGDTANVILRIDRGIVKAPAIIRTSIEAEVGRERLVASVARHFGVSRATAELRLNDFPTMEAPNHQPLGSGCAHSIDENCSCDPSAFFTILSQGVWQNFADMYGHGDELRALVEERRSVCWRDVLRLMFVAGQPHGKKLVLRPRLFEIAPGVESIQLGDSRLGGPHIDAMTPWKCDSLFGCYLETEDSSAHFYELDGNVVKVPAPASRAFSQEDAAAAMIKALKGIVPLDALSVAAVQSCLGTLRPLSAGALKSCLQKTIRFRAASVAFPKPYEGPPLAAPVVVAAAVALLFADKGSFSPDLQIFTRGETAALKRTAIILLEDAWVEAPGSSVADCVCALIALALASQRMTEYHTPPHIIYCTMRLAALASASPALIGWRGGSSKEEKVSICNDASKSLQSAAKLLRCVRSFAGDMDMFDRIAEMSCSGRLPIVFAKDQLPVMPLCHIVDQHTFRGVAHVLNSDDSSFRLRFTRLFDMCTGFNPRQADPKGFENSFFVQRARLAQRICLRFALRSPRVSLPPLSGDSEDTHIDVRVQLDPGILAAAVGPIKVALRCGKSQGGASCHVKDVFVLLGVHTPEDEVVMLRPARATRDLFGSLTDQERAEAIHEVRSRELCVRSPLLSDSRVATFRGGEWRLDGVKWSDFVAKGCLRSLPAVAAPKWVSDSASHSWSKLLRDDAALEDSLYSTGRGIVQNAERYVIALVGGAPYPIALRAISLTRQQYLRVTLPTPSLGGGLGSDQLAAYDGDWDVYRLLALVARLVPGALRPETPPGFSIQDAALLRAVERWMTQGVVIAAKAGVCSSATDALVTAWSRHSSWSDMRQAQANLMEHQRAAVARMHQRDREGDCGGHFLVMDTGLGKTITSLVYAYGWLCENGGRTVKRIVWVTPAGTVDNLVDQLRNTWSAPVHLVPRVAATRKGSAKAGEGLSLVLKDYVVNVVHADHLRTAIGKGLAEEAPASFFVFDEVDEMYAPTLRTSAARRLCQLCAKFVAQTATPLRRNESELVRWLADTCAYPVDNENWLVAASGMVSMQLELGIVAVEEEVLLPMVDAVRIACRRLLCSGSMTCWLEMARMVQEHTDEAMVSHAIQLAKKDRETHPGGGVLLVADTLAHASKLIDLCSPQIRTGDFASLESPEALEFGVVVVTKDKDRGYNSAARLGALVTGAYAGNGASRHQIRGRLRRLGQRRKEVRFVTVCMENSLLHLLHRRHSVVDTMNITLEQLGQRFSAELLEGLAQQTKRSNDDEQKP